MANQTITALYDSYDDASKAVAKLEASGISHSDISIVSSNENDRHAGRVATGDHTRTDTAETASTGAGTGAGVGTLLGGAAGLLTGLGLLAIPGVGPCRGRRLARDDARRCRHRCRGRRSRRRA